MSEGVIPEVTSATTQTFPLDRALLRRPALRLDQVGFVAEAGRMVLIGFALFMLDGSARPVSQGAALAIVAATCIWQYTLHRTAAQGRLVLGRAGAPALGAGLGLVVVALLNPTTVGLHASIPALLLDTWAVFSSALVWDSAVAWTRAGRRRLLLVGSDDVDVRIDDGLHNAGDGFEIVGAVAGSRELAEVIESRHPDIVVLMDESTYDSAVERIMDARANVRVATFASFCEYAFGRIPVDRISAGWFMSLLHPRHHVYTGFTKRTFDVVVATLALLLATPLLVTLALLTRLSAGRALYRQTRVGEGGRTFTIYKFRTMRCGAEPNGAMFACDDDPRVTRVGALLRRTHLDELPQLWNVLRGDMSIVGPRPERPEFVDMLETSVPFWSRRLLVKPGITGWAQVCCEYASDCHAMQEKLSYDLWYLRHRSVLVDAAVCARTVALQLRGVIPSRARRSSDG
jgi:exopolysaccharide biosynthesis polyprenyl glycosylphosphotransferase